MQQDADYTEEDRIAGQHVTIKERVIAAGYPNHYSDEEIFEMRVEIDALENQYFELAGETLK